VGIADGDLLRGEGDERGCGGLRDGGETGEGEGEGKEFLERWGDGHGLRVLYM
jgi:hypothetical protein